MPLLAANSTRNWKRHNWMFVFEFVWIYEWKMRKKLKNKIKKRTVKSVRGTNGTDQWNFSLQKNPKRVNKKMGDMGGDVTEQPPAKKLSHWKWGIMVALLLWAPTPFLVPTIQESFNCCCDNQNQYIWWCWSEDAFGVAVILCRCSHRIWELALFSFRCHVFLICLV